MVVLGTPACANERSPMPRPSPSVAPQLSSPAPKSVTAAPTGTAEQQILAVYRRYWTTVLPAVAAVPRGERRAILEPIMVEPALSSALALLLSMDRAGHKLYGHAVPVSQVLQRRGNAAALKGCIDSSGTGSVDVETGQYVSRGLRREAVLMTFTLGDDGVWRVYGMYFPKDPRC
jgi:hypothetical protein